jgi:RNA polymerase sigma factor (sigma-70 family)
MERPHLILETASDERLVALARAGDERAFAVIVARYRAPLQRHCRRFLFSAAAADDAVQQAFINAHAALIDGRPPLALKPWLYRIARNAALNVARDPQSGLEQVPDELQGADQPEDVFQRRETLHRMVGAVRALPDSQRQVIVRHAFGGDSHERIAADLGVTAGAVRQLAYRARGTLRAAA